MKQPAALRLVDDLSYVAKYSDWEHWDTLAEAATELRRLHAENERLTLNDGIHSCHQECQRPVCRLTRERDALLEALKEIAAIEDKMVGGDWEEIQEARGIARAAIKAVEGEAK